MLVIEVGVYKESVKAASSEPWHSAVASDLQSSGHHDCSLLQLVKAFFFFISFTLYVYIWSQCGHTS